MTRFREAAESQNFGTWALVWMLLTLIALGASIHTALRFGDSGIARLADGWYKARVLAETTVGFAVMAMIGAGLAALAPSSRSTRALSIGDDHRRLNDIGPHRRRCRHLPRVHRGTSCGGGLQRGRRGIRYVAQGGLGVVGLAISLRLGSESIADPEIS